MNFSEFGFNYRMTDFQAALVYSQLPRLQQGIEYKQKLANIYFNELNLININYSTSEISRVKVPSKVNLDNSNILRELKGKWGMKAAQ